MKDIPGYEGLYAVTTDGRIWSYPRAWKGGKSNNFKCYHPGKWLKPRIGKNDKAYYSVSLCNAGRSKSFYIHILVAKAYVPNPLNLPQVNHKDANRLNNSYSNLEWCTSSGNHKHAGNMGLFRPPRGEDHYFHKLSSKQVEEIRLRGKHGEIHRILGEEYGVSTTVITNIINMKARVYG